MNKVERITIWIMAGVVLLALLAAVVGAAAPVDRAAPTVTPDGSGWICPAGGECHVFIEWNGKQPTTLFILSNPPGCNSEENGDVGFIVTCE